MTIKIDKQVVKNAYEWVKYSGRQDQQIEQLYQASTGMITGITTQHSSVVHGYEFIEDYYGEGEHKKILQIPVGAFRRWKSWSGGRFVAVHRDSLFLSIPNIIGCCDHDWTSVTCDCGVRLGISRYDCWESQHSVDLDPSKVYFKN